MPYGADTNILLRYANVGDPEHALVTTAVDDLVGRGERLYYPHQVRREFWNVFTRPVSANGMGMTVADTRSALLSLDAIFTRLPSIAATDAEWDRIVSQYQVIGKSGTGSFPNTR
jgi:hypothetical protein